ncbi:MAG: hypothetical protein Q8M65_06790 [Rhodoglobus sp.]|nr:hypothetical protein [Rhodoglobus sp.]
MAYTRYSRECDWYIFWAASDATCREKELLAAWHAPQGGDGPTFNYSTIQDMLNGSGFAAIPGREASDDDLLRRVFSAFLKDVDQDWS